MDDILTKTIYGEQLNQTMTLSEAINLLRNDDLLNIGELAELAISIKSGVALCSKNTEAIDLVTCKQIKHALVTKPPSSKYYFAFLTIKKTYFPLLYVITNTILKEQYFLHIPYEAHKHLSGSCTSISFGRDGYPKPSQWWNYEVNSFEELCELAK